MTVRLDGNVIHLAGDCRVEEAEALLVLLQADHGRVVDISGCRDVHTSLVQVLLSYAPIVRGDPSDHYLRDLILPNLRRDLEP